MAFQPIRKEDGRRRVRFEFDGERGIIRHRDRDEAEGAEYRIKMKDGRYLIGPLEEDVSE